MFKYEVIEKNDNDTLGSTVRKTGLVGEFSLQAVYDHKLKVEQEIREKESKVELSKAVMANIENNHLDVKRIIDGIRKKGAKAEGIFGTLFLWVKEDMERDQNQRMIDERKALIEEYDKELDEIHEQTGIPKPVRISYTKANPDSDE